MKIKLHIFLFLFAFNLSAQDKPVFSMRGSVTIPKNIGSDAWKASFAGIYDGSFTLCFRINKGFFIGAGYQNYLFGPQKIFKNVLVNNNVTGGQWLSTRMQGHNGFIRLGYDQDFIEDKKGFYTFALNSGYSYNKYTSVVAPSDSVQGLMPRDYTCIFFRPEITFNFYAEGLNNVAFGIVFAYNYNLYVYDPDVPCFSSYADFSKYRNRSGQNWFSAGFTFYLAPTRKK